MEPKTGLDPKEAVGLLLEQLTELKAFESWPLLDYRVVLDTENTFHLHLVFPWPPQFHESEIVISYSVEEGYSYWTDTADPKSSDFEADLDHLLERVLWDIEETHDTGGEFIGDALVASFRKDILQRLSGTPLENRVYSNLTEQYTFQYLIGLLEKYPDFIDSVALRMEELLDTLTPEWE